MMINLNFSLFWAGGKISYLRYLTFKTLRYFHPNSKIDLYISKNYNKNVHRWNVEQQDFEKDLEGDSYLNKIKELDVNVIEMDYFCSPNYCAIYQVDLFRWWHLYNFGRFYLDSDQLILKSLETLPLEKDFIYSQFSNADRLMYSPTGIIGCSKGNSISKIMMDVVPKSYSPESYNSSGPFVFEYVIHKTGLLKNPDAFNAPYEYFYPINCSGDVDKIYDGKFIIPKRSYCLHWYAGHPLSQEFNRKYTKEFAKTSNDTISLFLREKRLI
jgi:hypothetical protein